MTRLFLLIYFSLFPVMAVDSSGVVDAQTIDRVLKLVAFKLEGDNSSPTAERVFVLKRDALVNWDDSSASDLFSFSICLNLLLEPLESGFCLCRIVREYPEMCTRSVIEHLAFAVWTNDQQNVAKKIHGLLGGHIEL